MVKFSFKKKKAQSDRNSWVLTHARGNLSARDAVEDEESPNSCEDDTSSESSDSDDSSNDSSTYFEESFDILRRVIWSDVCTRGRNPTSKTGGGGGAVALILPLCEGGGVEINFCLMRGGAWISFWVLVIESERDDKHKTTTYDCTCVFKFALIRKISWR